MQKKGSLTKLGSLISLPLALLLVIFFFLPWVTLTCSGHEIGKASGWQLTRGEMSPSGQMAEQQKEKESKDGEKDEKDDGPDARPLYIFGLLLPVGLLALGAAGAAGKMTGTGTGFGLIVLAVFGIVVIVSAAGVDYTEDMKKDMKTSSPGAQNQDAPAGMGQMGEQMEKKMQEQMSKSLKTEGTGILWTSLVLYILVILCGAANIILVRMMPAASAAPAAYGVETPPPDEPTA